MLSQLWFHVDFHKTSQLSSPFIFQYMTHITQRMYQIYYYLYLHVTQGTFATTQLIKEWCYCIIRLTVSLQITVLSLRFLGQVKGQMTVCKTYEMKNEKSNYQNLIIHIHLPTLFFSLLNETIAHMRDLSFFLT